MARLHSLLRAKCIAVASLTLGSLAPSAAQVPDATDENPDLIITAESNLVIVKFHVYRNDRSVNGLGPEAFELAEDGAVQEIAFVEGPSADPVSTESRTVPTEIIFLIDFSYSVMQPGLLDFSTIRSTMLEGLRKDVMISVYGFAANLKRFTGPTRDLDKLQRALDNTYASEAGGSRVYEAIMQTARDAANRGGHVSRMMIVFSDGFSTTSLDPKLAARSASALGIPVYPVVLGHERIARQMAGGGRNSVWPQQAPNRRPNPRANLRGANARAQERRMAAFADIGPLTGGRSYDLEVINNKVIRQILSSLSTIAETEYVVGYYPRSVDEELTAHQVEVRLASDEYGKLYGGRRIVVH